MIIDNKNLSFSEKIDFIDQKLAELHANFCLGENNASFHYDYALVNKLYALLSKPNSSLYEIYEMCGIENKLSTKDTFVDTPLFVLFVKLNRELLKQSRHSFDEYPFNIPIIQKMNEVKFNKRVTFLIGGNGIGKSTLLEALAVKLGVPAEGGTKNYIYSTHDTHSCLYQFINTASSYARPKEVFFFRAETFYNFATEYSEINGSETYHAHSHGENFMLLANERFKEKSLYILDEPEAALSFESQLQLMLIINELTKRGSQFIIATHSPILLAMPDSEILDLENNFEIINYKDTKIYKNYKSFINNSDGYLHHLIRKD